MEVLLSFNITVRIFIVNGKYSIYKHHIYRSVNISNYQCVVDSLVWIILLICIRLSCADTMILSISFLIFLSFLIHTFLIISITLILSPLTSMSFSSVSDINTINPSLCPFLVVILCPLINSV